MFDSSENITDEQLSQVKRRLNITWSDEDTDAKVKDYMGDAQVWMDEKLGMKMDYFTPGQHRTLYMNYVLYLWNGCANEFEQAYMREINELRRKIHVQM